MQGVEIFSQAKQIQKIKKVRSEVEKCQKTDMSLTNSLHRC